MVSQKLIERIILNNNYIKTHLIANLNLDEIHKFINQTKISKIDFVSFIKNVTFLEIIKEINDGL